MGLDCHVRLDHTNEKGEVVFYDLWYGRKENEIHNWMQQHSGVAAGGFNCVPLNLSLELLNLLEEDMHNGNLSPVTGYFFGEANQAREVNYDVSQIISLSRASIANGKQPYYTSWW